MFAILSIGGIGTGAGERLNIVVIVSSDMDFIVPGAFDRQAVAIVLFNELLGFSTLIIGFASAQNCSCKECGPVAVRFFHLFSPCGYCSTWNDALALQDFSGLSED